MLHIKLSSVKNKPKQWTLSCVQKNPPPPSSPLCQKKPKTVKKEKKRCIGDWSMSDRNLCVQSRFFFQECPTSFKAVWITWPCSKAFTTPWSHLVNPPQLTQTSQDGHGSREHVVVYTVTAILFTHPGINNQDCFYKNQTGLCIAHLNRSIVAIKSPWRRVPCKIITIVSKGSKTGLPEGDENNAQSTLKSPSGCLLEAAK